jgi:beta-1,4-mannosyltransferase
MVEHQYKIYFYPHTKRNFTPIKNPYTIELRQALSQQAEIVNVKPSGTGFLDILKYLNRINTVCFNWIENLPDKKGGFLQSIFLILFLHFHRWMGIKIIWTLHNKLSHYKKNLQMKRILFNTLLKKSDLILTHSSEGIRYARELAKGSTYMPNIHYFPHPAYHRLDNLHSDNRDKRFDILIWGTVAKYKGIDGFLEFLYNIGLENKFRILIAGKILSKEYEETILKFQNDHIRIINKFIDDAELVQYIYQSKITLFTYNSDSVLSSGALIFSFTHGASILGPDIGSFKDMNKEGYVDVFNDYKDLIVKLEKKLKMSTKVNNQKKIEEFEKKYNWNNFGQQIMKLINRL